MVIDCHAHWIPPAVADALRRRRAVPRIDSTQAGEIFVSYQGARPFDAALGDLEHRRSLMRRSRIDVQVLSLAGLFGIDCLPADESVPLVHAFNDAVIEVQRTDPHEFIGLAALPLVDIALACAELERSCAAGLRGAILPADGFRTLTSAARFLPLFEVGERHRCHFFVHPGPVESPPEANVRDTGYDNGWHRRIVLETQARLSEVMMTLNQSDYLDAFPHVTVQVANLGGTIAFLYERMDEVSRERGEGFRLALASLSRCYVDTASFGPRAIEMAVACFGEERVLLGTDCPIFDAGRLMNSLVDTNLAPATCERIRSGNALALFRRVQ
jgi:predicted TIM-barrel fold metal-dependent hydrolase